MKIIKLQTGPILTNTYILESKNSLIVIDPGGDYEAIIDVSKKIDKPIKFILLTHSHYDHVGAVGELQAIGAKAYIHKLELDFINSPSPVFGKIKPDILIEKEETLLLDGMPVRIIHTPGHSKGSVCFVADDNLFSGDTLFRLEIGRCDLPGGDFNVIKKSLQKLFALENNYTVHPGHGEKSNLILERKSNPYAQQF